MIEFTSVTFCVIHNVCHLIVIFTESKDSGMWIVIILFNGNFFSILLIINKIITTGQRILTKGRIAMWPPRMIPPILTPCTSFFEPIRVSPPQTASRSVQPVLRTSQSAAKIPNAVQLGGQLPPTMFPASWRIWTHLIYKVPWVHSSHPPKRHLDRFSHFCRAHEHD